jgi:hypothetical protein
VAAQLAASLEGLSSMSYELFDELTSVCTQDGELIIIEWYFAEHFKFFPFLVVSLLLAF